MDENITTDQEIIQEFEHLIDQHLESGFLRPRNAEVRAPLVMGIRRTDAVPARCRRLCQGRRLS